MENLKNIQHMLQSNRGNHYHQKQQQNLGSQLMNHDTIIHDLSNIAISTQPENQRSISNMKFDIALLGSSPLIEDMDMPSPIPIIPSDVIIKQSNLQGTDTNATLFNNRPLSHHLLLFNATLGCSVAH
jgi:hypothetical protein